MSEALKDKSRANRARARAKDPLYKQKQTQARYARRQREDARDNRQPIAEIPPLQQPLLIEEIQPLLIEEIQPIQKKTRLNLMINKLINPPERPPRPSTARIASIMNNKAPQIPERKTKETTNINDTIEYVISKVRSLRNDIEKRMKNRPDNESEQPYEDQMEILLLALKSIYKIDITPTTTPTTPPTPTTTPTTPYPKTPYPKMMGYSDEPPQMTNNKKLSLDHPILSMIKEDEKQQLKIAIKDDIKEETLKNYMYKINPFHRLYYKGDPKDFMSWVYDPEIINNINKTYSTPEQMRSLVTAILSLLSRDPIMSKHTEIIEWYRNLQNMLQVEINEKKN